MYQHDFALASYSRISKEGDFHKALIFVPNVSRTNVKNINRFANRFWQDCDLTNKRIADKACLQRLPRELLLEVFEHLLQVGMPDSFGDTLDNHFTHPFNYPRQYRERLKSAVWTLNSPGLVAFSMACKATLAAAAMMQIPEPRPLLRSAGEKWPNEFKPKLLLQCQDSSWNCRSWNCRNSWMKGGHHSTKVLWQRILSWPPGLFYCPGTIGDSISDVLDIPRYTHGDQIEYEEVRKWMI